MSTYSSFKTDETLEVDGVELDLGKAGKFKICRAGGANKRFAKKFQELTKPYRRAIQTESIDEVKAGELLRAAYVETIILGWSGVTDENDQPLPFSKKNADKLLADLPWLFDEIRKVAEDQAVFRQVILEADGKNSVTSSDTR